MLPVSELLKVAQGHAHEPTGRGAQGRFAAGGATVPVVVVWNVNRQCNMRCPHCYASASTAPGRDELSTNEARRLIDELAERGVAILIFSGGEPLLREDLPGLIDYARGRGLHPQLSTNGVLIDIAMAQRLRAAGVQYVGISIDGLAEFNDAYRGLEHGFARASAGLQNAKAAGMRTGLRVTLTRENREQLSPLLEHARELKADRFYVSHLVYSGRALRSRHNDLTPSESREQLHALFSKGDELLRQRVPLEIVTGGNDSDGPALLLWLERHYGTAARQRVEVKLRQRGGNSAGEKLLNIDHRGEVHPDQFWSSASLGNLRNQRFSQILQHPLRQQLRVRRALLHGRCGGCSFQAMCGGSHRERALAVTRNMWSPDPACVMTDAEIGLVESTRKGVA